MNEKQINEKLRKEIEEETPEIWETLMEKLPEEMPEQSVSPQPFHRVSNNRGRIYLFASAAVLLAAVILAAVTFTQMRPLTANTVEGGVVTNGDSAQIAEVSGQDAETAKPQAVHIIAKVTLDVNPSIELEVDDHDKVAGCRSYNKEGAEILRLMDLEGADVTVASYAVIGAMVTKGYLTENTNSVLLCVTAEEKEQGHRLQKELSDRLNSYLADSTLEAAVIGQLIDANDEVRAFSEKHGISEGKAWIIQYLCRTFDNLTEDSLLKLSTQELLVLWTNKKTDLSEMAVEYGTVSVSQYITEEEAVAEALTYAGADPSEADNIYTEFDCDDGMIVYEVKFVYGGRSYEVEVHAETGAVLEYDLDEGSAVIGSEDVDDETDNEDDADEEDFDSDDGDDDNNYDSADADDDSDDNDSDDADDDADDDDD